MLRFGDAELASVLDVGGSSGDLLRVKSSSALATAMYKEVQVHGFLEMARDVEALVLNGCHKKNAEVQRLAEKFAARFGVNVVQLD
jgi:hypothetical protein